MDDKLIKKELKTYRFINLFAFTVSYFALAMCKVLTLYKLNVIIGFVFGFISLVVSPYFTLLFKQGKKSLAALSGLIGPTYIIVCNIITLSSFSRKFNICMITGTVILICVIFIRIYEVKKSKKKIRKKKELLKSFQIVTSTICIFAIAMSAPTAFETSKLLPLNAVDESKIISSSIEATNNAGTKENSLIKAHLKELMPIIDGTYKDLSLNERLDIFQTITNIECTYFGSSIAVSVKLKSISPRGGIIYAYYTEEEKTIYLNELVFNDLSVEDALYTILHEDYHIYQNEQKKLYEAVPKELRNLSSLSGAKECKEGLDRYISGSTNYDEYKNQIIETQADSYAYTTTKEYIRLIRQYSKDSDYK